MQKHDMDFEQVQVMDSPCGFGVIFDQIAVKSHEKVRVTYFQGFPHIITVIMWSYLFIFILFFSIPRPLSQKAEYESISGFVPL